MEISTQKYAPFLDHLEAAAFLGICGRTLNNWEITGKVTAFRKQNGYKVYKLTQLEVLKKLNIKGKTLESIKDVHEIDLLNNRLFSVLEEGFDMIAQFDDLGSLKELIDCHESRDFYVNARGSSNAPFELWIRKKEFER